MLGWDHGGRLDVLPENDDDDFDVESNSEREDFQGSVCECVTIWALIEQMGRSRVAPKKK